MLYWIKYFDRWTWLAGHTILCLDCLKLHNQDEILEISQTEEGPCVCCGRKAQKSEVSNG